jgi:dihydroxy-acid dehydratase
MTPKYQIALARWKSPTSLYSSGVLAKYARLVADASHGAVTDLSGRATA